MHFHTPNSNTLDEFVAKDLMPNEYGGRAGTIQDIHSDWIKKVEDHRYSQFCLYVIASYINEIF